MVILAQVTIFFGQTIKLWPIVWHNLKSRREILSELKPWSERILAAQTTEEVFAILDEFRPLLWSDEERASLSKTYNAKLNQINTNQVNAGNKQLEKTSKGKSSSNISKQDAGNQRGESTSSNQELDEDEIVL